MGQSSGRFVTGMCCVGTGLSQSYCLSKMVKFFEKPEIRGLHDVFVFSDWRGAGWASTPGWFRLYIISGKTNQV